MRSGLEGTDCWWRERYAQNVSGPAVRLKDVATAYTGKRPTKIYSSPNKEPLCESAIDKQARYPLGCLIVDALGESQ